MPRGISTIRCIRLVLEIWSFNVYFSGSLLHRYTAQPSFSHYDQILRKNAPKGARKYKTGRAHAPPKEVKEKMLLHQRANHPDQKQ